MSVQWPPLRDFLDGGKIDLGNSEALLEYNRALLWSFTGVRIELPPGRLIPAVCLRETYVRAVIDMTGAKTIVDVGTGSTAVIALLARSKGLSVVATELSGTSYDYAVKNTAGTGIKIFRSEGDIFRGVVPENVLRNVDAALTYPPFYPEEVPGRTSKKKRGFKGVDNELFSGETGLDFIKNFIHGCKAASIPYATLLLHKKSFADKAMSLLEIAGYHPRVVYVQAGNRERYVVVGK